MTPSSGYDESHRKNEGCRKTHESIKKAHHNEIEEQPIIDKERSHLRESKNSKSSQAYTASGSNESRLHATSSKPESQNSTRLTSKHSNKETTWSKCYDVPRPHRHKLCRSTFQWQCGKYVKDDCGSGIVPAKYDLKNKEKCKTPSTMYQDTVGKLGKEIYCGETVIIRNMNKSPPCNICEIILPPCKEHYQKYDCLKPCEENAVTYKDGKKIYRDRVERYWRPCIKEDQRNLLDVNMFAGNNVALGIEMKRKHNNASCW